MSTTTSTTTTRRRLRLEWREWERSHGRQHRGQGLWLLRGEQGEELELHGRTGQLLGLLRQQGCTGTWTLLP